MIWVIVAIAVAQGEPAKLIIVHANQPPAVINYPSLARCERAKEALRRQTFDPQAGKVENLPNGGVLVHSGNPTKAYCIPG